MVINNNSSSHLNAINAVAFKTWRFDLYSKIRCYNFFVAKTFFFICHYELEKLRIINSHLVLTVKGKESSEWEELISSSPASAPNNLSHLASAASVCGHKSASVVDCCSSSGGSEKPLSIPQKSAVAVALWLKWKKGKKRECWGCRGCDRPSSAEWCFSHRHFLKGAQCKKTIFQIWL